VQKYLEKGMDANKILARGSKGFRGSNGYLK